MLKKIVIFLALMGAMYITPKINIEAYSDGIYLDGNGTDIESNPLGWVQGTSKQIKSTPNGAEEPSMLAGASLGEAGCSYYSYTFARIKAGLTDPAKENVVDVFNYIHKKGGDKGTADFGPVNWSKLPSIYSDVEYAKRIDGASGEYPEICTDRMSVGIGRAMDDGYHVILLVTCPNGPNKTNGHYIYVDSIAGNQNEPTWNEICIMDSYGNSQTWKAGYSSYGGQVVGYVLVKFKGGEKPKEAETLWYRYGMSEEELPPPDFTYLTYWNEEQDGGENPYPYGLCTYLSWGMFYQTYGFRSPCGWVPSSFYNELDWACQLTKKFGERAGDKFEISTTPVVGATVSMGGGGHLGSHTSFITKVNDDGTVNFWEANVVHGGAEESPAEVDLLYHENWTLQQVSYGYSPLTFANPIGGWQAISELDKSNAKRGKKTADEGEWGLTGMPNKSPFMENPKESPKLMFREDLSSKEQVELGNLSTNVSATEANNRMATMRKCIMMGGMVLCLYSVFMLLAYMLDIANPFINISMLTCITGGLIRVDYYKDGGLNPFNQGQGSTKALLFIGMTMVVGILICTGTLSMYVVNKMDFMNNLLDNVWIWLSS